MRIAIDIGHTSKKDQGAVSACGLSEHAYWASLVGEIRDKLVELGHCGEIDKLASVRIFRREDFAYSVADECKEINRWGADVAISLHLNSADNKGAGGHEIIYHDGSVGGKRLAECMDAALDVLPLRDRGVRTPYNGRGETFLRQTRMPAVILEAAFLSNVGDVDYLRRHKRELVAAVVRGIDSFRP